MASASDWLCSEDVEAGWDGGGTDAVGWGAEGTGSSEDLFNVMLDDSVLAWIVSASTYGIGISRSERLVRR